MLRTISVCLDSVSIPLLRRAVSLRLGPLGLFSNTTNIFRLADGSTEGLWHNAFLDFCGNTATLRAPSPVSVADMQSIATVLESSFAEHLRGTVDTKPLNEDDSRVMFALPLRVGPVPLMECGVTFPSPKVIGRREMRAARQAFALAVTAQASTHKNAQNNTQGTVAVLDASALDTTMSRVAATHAGAEVYFAPIGSSAAAALRGDESLASIVRLHTEEEEEEEEEEKRTEKEKKEKLSSRFAVVALTASPETCAGPVLSRLITKTQSHGTLLVTLVDSSRTAESLRQCAKECIAHALEEQRRDGAVVGEILPAADCPSGGAATVMLCLDSQ